EGAGGQKGGFINCAISVGCDRRTAIVVGQIEDALGVVNSVADGAPPAVLGVSRPDRPARHQHNRCNNNARRRTQNAATQHDKPPTHATAQRYWRIPQIQSAYSSPTPDRSQGLRNTRPAAFTRSHAGL